MNQSLLCVCFKNEDESTSLITDKEGKIRTFYRGSIIDPRLMVTMILDSLEDDFEMPELWANQRNLKISFAEPIGN